MLALANLLKLQCSQSKKNLWLFLFLVLAPFLSHTVEVSAQITPDNTLPNNSITTPNGNLIEITGGTTAGNNLFHSFQEFSVLNGQTALFNNGLTIENILSRITGNSISNIDGLIRSNGSASLFLINPNGIIFGENASLDIGGSFYGSTADSILFPDGVEFSAKNRQDPILTINIPIGLGFGDNPGDIVNNSIPDDNSSLSVSPGASFTLLGGDVNFTGGAIDSSGSNIFIGGLSESGTISVDDNFHPSFPDDVARADVSIINGAMVDVSAGGGGSITINARNLEVREGSQLLAGIREGLGTSEAQAGDITINATDTVFFDNDSNAFNDVNSEGVGNAGNVSVTTGSLEVTNGAQLGARTFAEGNAGGVTINATSSVKFDGEDKNGNQSGAFSIVQSGAVGKVGGISINTGSLEVTNGAGVGAFTRGKGDAGSVTINATDLVKIDGESKDGFPSEVFSSVNSNGVGKVGGVSITTASLEVTNGAVLDANTFGEGDGGRVTINATDFVKINGKNKDGFPSAVSSKLFPEAVGKAGGVSITTASLEVLNGAQVSASTFGKGNAGSVNINATDSVKFDGESENGFPSGAFSQVNPGAEGKAGGVSITTGSLEVTNGAQLGARTFGEGDAGLVTIKATDLVKFDGEAKDGTNSGAFSNVQPDAVGKAGGVSITTNSLEVTNGAQISASTEGEGDAGLVEINANTFEASNGGQLVSDTSSQSPAGNIILNVEDDITLSGSETGIFANTTEGSTGKGGSINIDPQSVTIQDGATIAVNSDGSGQGGSITLAAEELTLDNGSITAETASNQGGNITLGIQELLSLINSGEITATAGTDQAGGDGGNIAINSDFIVGFPTQEQYRITANAFEGNGGNIDITTNAIFGAELFDISASSQFGLEGEISINTPDVNPLQGLDNLPTEVVDASQLIAKRCLAGDGETAEQQSEFTITGRGGLPSNPHESLRGDAVLSPEWVSLDSETAEKKRRVRRAKEQESIVPPQIEIVQATGWIIKPNGKVRLIANNPNSVPSSPGIKHPHCHASK